MKKLLSLFVVSILASAAMAQTPPPPPPPPVPPAPPVIGEYEGPDPEIEFEIIDPPCDVPPPPPPPGVTKKDQCGEEIVQIPEVEAVFPGGEGAMMRFISQNIKYPPMAKDSGIQGKVFIRFVVEKDGSVSNITIMRGVEDMLDNEAIRVIKKFPSWAPAKQFGKPVRSYYMLPINFRLN